MAHNPVNHPARPIYRAISGLTGLYLVGFGGLGLIASAGNEFFAQDDTAVLGQGTNLGYSVMALALGALVLAGVALGRNIDVVINKLFAYVFMVIGLGSLALLRTDANYLNFTVSTVIVAMLIGLVLVTASMYGRAGSDEEHRAWREATLQL